MKELHRILKPHGKLLIKVPHFSRGFAHTEHNHGFDITFPLYFKKEFKPGYFGVDFELEKMEMQWLVFFHLMPYMGYSPTFISLLKVANKIVSFFANLNMAFCARIWCFWVGGFDQIEFKFKCIK